MRLKRLVLHGYKTFASKTDFVFDEGITAIVGPNGSGKSNVADAVRWVLGEQSYSTLRGKRTVDMIFAGSQSRARAGMAQVILTLNNSDGWLPIDYTEVEIGRRAFRSGENEYILNGQKVRLKDVTKLLATSGLAQRTYTIIGQGLVDQALSLRAEERRALFEEAAGISHYKAKRAETLRRLGETARNLERVHDILAEIRPRLTSLKRQATRARNYEQLTADLHHLLRIWYGYKWEQAKVEMRQARETAASAEKSWRESRHKLQVQQENMAGLRRRIHRLQQQTADLQNKRDEARNRSETARRNVAILQERRQSLEKQLAELQGEKPALEEQRTAAQAELATATADLEAAHATLKESQQELQQFNATFQGQQTEINRWQDALNRSEKERQEAQTQLAQAQGQLSQLLSEERGAKGKGREAGELVEVEALIERFTADLHSARATAGGLSRKRNETRAARQELIGELKRLRQAHREEEQRLNKQRTQLARLEARVDLLGQMRQKQAQAGDDAPIIGNLAALITIPDQYQTALQAALAARLATLVLADEADLWGLVNSDAQEQGFIAAALSGIRPPDEIATPPDSAVISRADELVACGPDIRPLAQLLLGQVFLVTDNRAAYRIAQILPPGAMAVAPDGFVVYAGGLVETRGRHATNDILSREEAWRKGVDETGKIKDEVARMETAVAGQWSIIREKQERVDGLQTEEQRLRQWEQEANQRLSQAQSNVDRNRQQQTFLIRQQETRQKEATRRRERIQKVEQRIGAYQEMALRLETAVTTARAKLQSLPVAEAQQQLLQNINTARTIVAGRQAVVDSRRATLNQFENQLGRAQERQASLQRQKQQLRLTGEETEGRRLQERLDELSGSLESLKTRLTTKRKELAQIEEKTAVIQKQAHDRETIYTQVKIALSQQKSEIEGLQERVKADLGLVALSYDEDQTGPTPLPMRDVVQQLPQVTELPDDAEETIRRYRAQMQRMGAINPDAPTEYEETQNRYDFLTQQIEDLNQTEAQLRQVISELDELTSRAFMQTVEKVNNVFGETFTQLFGGGAGRLVLTEPDDLTVSGVDIIARLPNRREQGLALLSGGERSLTAAALIFSLLKVAPTPFCVMDEVDAALDEANINRFRQLLRELSLKTQFIVITHNRGTVQAAQTIYGISMGADSVSQAISIKPEEYLKQSSLLRG